MFFSILADCRRWLPLSQPFSDAVYAEDADIFSYAAADISSFTSSNIEIQLLRHLRQTLLGH